MNSDTSKWKMLNISSKRQWSGGCSYRIYHHLIYFCFVRENLLPFPIFILQFSFPLSSEMILPSFLFLWSLLFRIYVIFLTMEKLTTIFSPSLNASLPNLLSDVNEHILDLLSSSMWALSVKIPFETECFPGSRKKQFHRLYISTGLNSSPLHQKKKNAIYFYWEPQSTNFFKNTLCRLISSVKIKSFWIGP